MKKYKVISGMLLLLISGGLYGAQSRIKNIRGRMPQQKLGIIIAGVLIGIAGLSFLVSYEIARTRTKNLEDVIGKKDMFAEK